MVVKSFGIPQKFRIYTKFQMAFNSNLLKENLPRLDKLLSIANSLANLQLGKFYILLKNSIAQPGKNSTIETLQKRYEICSKLTIKTTGRNLW